MSRKPPRKTTKDGVTETTGAEGFEQTKVVNSVRFESG